MRKPFIIKPLAKWNPDGIYGVDPQPKNSLLMATEDVDGQEVVVEMKVTDGITAYKDLKNLLSPDMPKPTLQSVMEEGNTSDVAMYITGNNSLAPLKDGLLLIKGGILSLAPTDNPEDPTRWQLGTLTANGEDVGVQLSASTSAAAEGALQVRKQSPTQAGLVAGSGAIPKGRIALADAINDNEAVTLQQMDAAIALESENLLHKTGDETKNGVLTIASDTGAPKTELRDGAITVFNGQPSPNIRNISIFPSSIVMSKGGGNGIQIVSDGSSGTTASIKIPQLDSTLDNYFALRSEIPSPVDLTPYQLKSEKGQPNGYPSLDQDAKILAENLPDSILGGLRWGGTYDGEIVTASLGFPELDGQPLPNPEDYDGVFFLCSADFQKDEKSFYKGDWIVATGTNWERIANVDAVTSVNGRIGSVQTNLAEQSDVAFTTLYNNDFIKYDSTTGKFTNNQIAQVALTNDYYSLDNKPDLSTKANLNTANTFTGNQGISHPTDFGKAINYQWDKIAVVNDGSGLANGEILFPPITTNRAWTFPNASGTGRGQI